MASRIAVVGSANVDLFCRVPKLPAPGETVTGGTFDQAAGGKGANQAVAAARLGADVSFIARVGDDAHGRDAVAGYQREGIETAAITYDPAAATGVALILVESGGENLIAVAPGANHRLTPAQVDAAADALGQAAALLLQLETPLPAVLAAARLARAAGTTVILNPAPMPTGGLPTELLAQVDVLILNEHEAAALGGAEALTGLGVPRVVLTLGAAGARVLGEGEAVAVPAPKVTAVDAVGAGDAFCGALAVALANGRSAVEGARWACCAGALAATRPGAQPSLPTRDEVDKLYATLE